MPISEINILEGVQNQKKIYRVRIGPVANLKLADELTELLSQRGLTGTRIVTD
jgi:cell division protein FtsN